MWVFVPVSLGASMIMASFPPLSMNDKPTLHNTYLAQGMLHMHNHVIGLALPAENSDQNLITNFPILHNTVHYNSEIVVTPEGNHLLTWPNPNISDQQFKNVLLREMRNRISKDKPRYYSGVKRQVDATTFAIGSVYFTNTDTEIAEGTPVLGYRLY